MISASIYPSIDISLAFDKVTLRPGYSVIYTRMRNNHTIRQHDIWLIFLNQPDHLINIAQLNASVFP